MARVNLINNASSTLTVDPGASGDSEVIFSLPPVPTVTFGMGVDDTDGDAFKISLGSTLGSNDVIKIAATGEVTKPLQPSFYAYLGSDDANVTGDGTNYTIGTNTALTEVYDINSDFNTNGTFTAPVTGTYEFSLCVYFGPMTSSQTGAYATFNASNHDLEFGFVNPYGARYNPGTDDNYGLLASCYVQMDAADTMNFKIDVSTTGLTVDLLAGSNDATVVSGFLVL